MTANFIPLLLKPRILGWKNIWLKAPLKEKFSIRKIILAATAAIVIVSLFQACHDALLYLQSSQERLEIPIQFILNAALVCLFVLLVLSCLANALSSLFFAKDLDLVLAAPLSMPRFYLNKLIEVLISSSWLILLLAAPILSAFYFAYQPPLGAAMAALAAITAVIVLPALIAMALIPPLFRAFPLIMRKAAAPLIAAAFVAFLFTIILMLPPSNTPRHTPDITEVRAQLASVWWEVSPATSASQLCAALLFGSEPWVKALINLVTWLAGFALLSYVSVTRYYFNCYSETRLAKAALRLNSKRSQHLSAKLLFFVAQDLRALMLKEFKIFARSATQLLQLFLLMLLCLLYIYNIRLMQELRGSPLTVMIWNVLLIICNVLMGSFITTSIATRFVYPSLSLEGRSFWILQKAPVNIRTVLYAKFLSWILPIAAISTVVMASGAMAVQADLDFIVLTIACAIFLSIGIVGLAIGFATAYASFEWEHPGQLSANIGSMLFIISSTVFTLVNLLPIAFMLVISRIEIIRPSVPAFERQLGLATGILIVFLLNIAALKFAVEAGASSIESRNQSS
ncbi:MAG: hypothetical protein J5J00_07755 [Deltaproteobacteria bacterium]|nr:hypothetical protein [Deltaproteobacteria bacterium]